MRKNNIEGYVTFVGSLTELEMVEFYQQMDVFCYLGSPQCPGGSTASLSVFEAQSCGVPVLRTLGADEEIVDGKSGYLIPEYKPLTIANAIRTFMQLSESKRNSMSREARKHIKSTFSWDQSAKSLDTALQQLINH